MTLNKDFRIGIDAKRFKIDFESDGKYKIDDYVVAVIDDVTILCQVKHVKMDTPDMLPSQAVIYVTKILKILEPLDRVFILPSRFELYPNNMKCYKLVKVSSFFDVE